MKYKAEYIWLDGYEPTPNLRSKTKIVSFDGEPTVEDMPIWNFDGSSTRQAPGDNSDCLLQPVALFPDPARTNAYLVLCEVLLADGTPHPSNGRATIPDDPDAWFGFEQEYFLWKDGVPLGFPREGYPAPQGEYYTGVGYKNVGDIAREIVDEHIDLCLAAGINLEREVGGVDYFEALMAAFDEHKDAHISVYGADNHLRLTGLHETQAIDKFNYGVANRGASIRVPHSFVNSGHRGYLEDRRPNPLADPYAVAGRIIETISLVPAEQLAEVAA